MSLQLHIIRHKSSGPSASEELMVTSLLNLQDLSIGMLVSIKTHCVACHGLCIAVQNS